MCRLKRVFLILLSMLLLSGCVMLKNGKRAVLENNVVLIKNDNLQGSGVLYRSVGDSVIFVTAAHVVSNAQKVIVQENKTDRIHLVEGLDLVFLVIDEIKLSADLKTLADENAAAADQVQDQLVLKGYDASGAWLEVDGMRTESWIYVEDFGCHMMIGKAEAVPGMSGGGVFDQNGNFLGIICGIDEEGNVAILPASVIASEYEVLFGADAEK